MIEVNGLTKRYGRHLATDALAFTVQRGEVVGFLGPNGAGKTTTMNMITGYLSPTSGTASVGGHDILEEPREVKRLIGYLPESPPLYGEMTVEEYLDFVGRAKRVAVRGLEAEIARVAGRTGIADVRRRLIRNLSKGYRQRVGLAQALLGNPPVLILDEPTIGLDPRQIVEIRTLIRDLGREHTVILSTHILPEVTEICQRVIIIHKGRIVAGDTIARLAATLRGAARMLIRIEGSAEEAKRRLAALPEVAKVESRGTHEPGTADLYVEARGDADLRRPVGRALCDARLPLLSIKPMDLTLEEIFMQLTTDERADGTGEEGRHA